jgi:hypothetical protein
MLIGDKLQAIPFALYGHFGGMPVDLPHRQSESLLLKSAFTSAISAWVLTHGASVK